MIENAACEPEVADVASCLTRWGRGSRAQARPPSSSTVWTALKEQHAVLPDRIETGTYAMAVGAAGGDVYLDGARADLLPAALDVLCEAGIEISETNRGLRVTRNGASLKHDHCYHRVIPGLSDLSPGALMALIAGPMASPRSAKRSSKSASCMCRSWPAWRGHHRLGDLAKVRGVRRGAAPRRWRWIRARPFRL